MKRKFCYILTIIPFIRHKSSVKKKQVLLGNFKIKTGGVHKYIEDFYLKINDARRSLFFILPILFIIFFTHTSYASESKYKVLVDVEESRLYLFENNIHIKTYKCAGGKYSTPSPIGTWTIISKDTWGEGFGGSWLGFNVPWGQFGLHGTLETYSVGWASSHGCIRLNNDEVAELYKILPIGTKVTIVDGVYGPFGKGFRNLKSGMYGSDVLEIQKRLKELGFFNSNPNGKFGSETEKAVKRYCKENNLYIRNTIDIELQKHMGFNLVD